MGTCDTGQSGVNQHAQILYIYIRLWQFSIFQNRIPSFSPSAQFPTTSEGFRWKTQKYSRAMTLMVFCHYWSHKWRPHLRSKPFKRGDDTQVRLSRKSIFLVWHEIGLTFIDCIKQFLMNFIDDFSKQLQLSSNIQISLPGLASTDKKKRCRIHHFTTLWQQIGISRHDREIERETINPYVQR